MSDTLIILDDKLCLSISKHSDSTKPTARLDLIMCLIIILIIPNQMMIFQVFTLRNDLSEFSKQPECPESRWKTPRYCDKSRIYCCLLLRKVSLGLQYIPIVYQFTDPLKQKFIQSCEEMNDLCWQGTWPGPMDPKRLYKNVHTVPRERNSSRSLYVAQSCE